MSQDCCSANAIGNSTATAIIGSWSVWLQGEGTPKGEAAAAGGHVAGRAEGRLFLHTLPKAGHWCAPLCGAELRTVWC